MPSEETRRLLKLFGIAVTDLEVAVAKGAAKDGLAGALAELSALHFFRDDMRLTRFDAVDPTAAGVLRWRASAYGVRPPRSASRARGAGGRQHRSFPKARQSRRG